MLIENTQQLREAVRTPYAWPGGYPTFILMDDGETLCHACARTEYRALSTSLRHGDSDGWRPVCQDVNWEDANMYCAHCSKHMEVAYS